MARQVLTVRALTLYVKGLLERDQLLAEVWVRGEVSNFKHHTSGHLYFTLKDETAQVRAVMFRSAAQTLRFRPESGLRVLARGYVSVYERDGTYQLYVREMEPDGLGALHLAFEQLKARLAAEGLFAPERKRALPRLPRKVGLVTSPTGAAVRDMIIVAQRRFANVHLVLAPAQVQGAEAPTSLIGALAAVARVPGVDVVIIGRGGGSSEELWAFNDESLARAIAACPVPVVSAVGHETDVTIADFVADARAATPSAAAELVVPSKAELRSAIDTQMHRAMTALQNRIRRERARLAMLLGRPVLTRPQQRIHQQRQRLDELARRLGATLATDLRHRRVRLAEQVGRLDSLSPLAVMARGYAIVRTPAGQVVRSADRVAAGDPLEVLVQRGRLQVRVEAVGAADAVAENT